MRARYLAALLLSVASPLHAEEPDAAAGRDLFQGNCAPCHGAGGKGDGPMAAILSVKPADLTKIANGGEFPMADVVRRIDGRDMLLAHGGPMPIFGYILEDRSAVIDDPDGTPVFTSQAVLDIAAWLATIQE